jgi:hypothetical protein
MTGKRICGQRKKSHAGKFDSLSQRQGQNYNRHNGVCVITSNVLLCVGNKISWVILSAQWGLALLQRENERARQPKE